MHQKHGHHNIECHEEMGVTTWVLDNLPEEVMFSLQAETSRTGGLELKHEWEEGSWQRTHEEVLESGQGGVVRETVTAGTGDPIWAQVCGPHLPY